MKKLHRLYLEKDEIVEMIISVVAISFALGVVFSGTKAILDSTKEFMFFMLPLLVTVGSGFILHEMSHKLIAIYYGAKAKFRMWTQGLIFMLMASAFGFLFAAPGAVYIYSDRITKRQNGLISLAGPVLNVFIMLFFIILELAAPITQYFTFLAHWGTDFSGFGIVNGSLHVWRFGVAMNLLIALFNMIPAFPLDGSKVFRWNRGMWLLSMAFLLGMGLLIYPPLVISWGLLLIVVFIISKMFFG